MTVHVFGIPNCSTVKKSLTWLDAHGVTTVFVDYRKNPPSKETVARWIAAFGTKALKNTSGGSYRALPNDKHTWSDDAWLDAFVRDPMLIKRPVLVRSGVPVQVGFRATPEELQHRLLS